MSGEADVQLLNPRTLDDIARGILDDVPGAKAEREVAQVGTIIGKLHVLELEGHAASGDPLAVAWAVPPAIPIHNVEVLIGPRAGHPLGTVLDRDIRLVPRDPVPVDSALEHLPVPVVGVAQGLRLVLCDAAGGSQFDSAGPLNDVDGPVHPRLGRVHVVQTARDEVLRDCPLNYSCLDVGPQCQGDAIVQDRNALVRQVCA
mmetsp:Transcript_9905/g.17508  ORF Transcript_9905/g.17508 Transcript_9905/m.17508 type:complete len:202 (-) Transcript_9905:2008-2613(-)